MDQLFTLMEDQLFTYLNTIQKSLFQLLVSNAFLLGVGEILRFFDG